MYSFIGEFNTAEFARKKGSKNKKLKKKLKALPIKALNPDLKKMDRLSLYESLNIPLRAWSNANQSIREVRGIYNSVDKYRKEARRFS